MYSLSPHQKRILNAVELFADVQQTSLIVRYITDFSLSISVYEVIVDETKK